MLATIGAESIEELFSPIPSSVRLQRDLALPPPMTEAGVVGLLEGLARANRPADSMACFAGGGAYDHYIPAVVRHLAYRAEFATSYTPYQPELSQGVLGVLFEYQSMVCELSGMDVANASLYDGAAALVEAVNLATGATRRSKVVVTQALNPNYRTVLETAGAGGALLVVAFDPTSAGILEAPGLLGADVATAEGQSLGNGLNYGGPYLGIFATKKEHIRRVPGRIVGATVDGAGRGGFVLTLQAREQHIRREKATSNVCTNQTLMAIAATVYLSWLGPKGLEELGESCLAKAHRAADLASSVSGCSLAFDAPFFKEFTLRVPGDAAPVQARLADCGYLVGPTLGAVDPSLSDCLIVAVTERRSNEEIEGLCKALAEVVA